MEIVGASRIFLRSEKNRRLQYTQYYGDGDSKAFMSVKDTYGLNSVTKFECIGHVQKRVGSRLRKLKTKTKGLSGKGKLTDNFIDRLQNYYGIAVRSNVGNLSAMQQNDRRVIGKHANRGLAGSRDTIYIYIEQYWRDGTALGRSSVNFPVGRMDIVNFDREGSVRFSIGRCIVEIIFVVEEPRNQPYVVVVLGWVSERKVEFKSRLSVHKNLKHHACWRFFTSFSWRRKENCLAVSADGLISLQFTHGFGSDLRVAESRLPDVDFIETKNKTAEGISDMIVTKLKADGLDIMDCRGQAYDNAITIAGCSSE
ncbi:uncharacterized protein TNCV_894101 [Trichonephila clavipes]|nr:uncharacterized protein TNCV_894101 [Trichonephila clavipes]